jgi:hypothetical protein
MQREKPTAASAVPLCTRCGLLPLQKWAGCIGCQGPGFGTIDRNLWLVDTKLRLQPDHALATATVGFSATKRARRNLPPLIRRNAWLDVHISWERTDRQWGLKKNKAESLELKLITEPGDELECDLLAIGWSFVPAPIGHDVEKEASLANISFFHCTRLDRSSPEKQNMESCLLRQPSLGANLYLSCSNCCYLSRSERWTLHSSRA